MAAAGVLLAACGSERAQPEPTPTRAPVAEPPPARDGFSIHEWGVLAYDALSPDATVVVAGSPMLRTTGHGAGLGGGDGNAYKPVLYVHLAEGARTATFTASVVARRGTIVESWPLAAATTSEEGQGVRWNRLVATADRASCSATALTYPAYNEPPCSTAPDHFCEAQNAHAYETADGACLRTGDGRFATQLFYRATIARNALPFDVTRDGAQLVVRAQDGAPHVTLLRVHRGPAPGMTRAARFDAPAAGATTPVPDATEEDGVALVDREIFGALTRMGLSAPESEAFHGAWDHAMTARGRADGGWSGYRAIHPALTPPEDALYYWLPASSAAELLPLAFDPAPTSVSRALLVRISLDAPHGELPIATSESRAELHVDEARGLPVPVVERVARRYVNQIRFCAEATASGEQQVTVAWEIDSDGKTRVVDASASPPVRQMTECVAQAVAGWTFPVPDSVPGHVRATWHLTPIEARSRRSR